MISAYVMPHNLHIGLKVPANRKRDKKRTVGAKVTDNVLFSCHCFKFQHRESINPHEKSHHIHPPHTLMPHRHIAISIKWSTF